MTAGSSQNPECTVSRLYQRLIVTLSLPTALPYQESGVQARRLPGILLRPRQHGQLPVLVPAHRRGGDVPV